jgi:hypothetical protein
MWGGFGQSMAILNYMTTGLVYKVKIPVTYIDTGTFNVPVNVQEDVHSCDWRDYPEVCQDCYENHIDGLTQFEEDQYRDRN